MSMLGMGGMLSRSALSGRLTLGTFAADAAAAVAGSGFSPLDLHTQKIQQPQNPALQGAVSLACIRYAAGVNVL